jgi:hypothetical protein
MNFYGRRRIVSALLKQVFFTSRNSNRYLYAQSIFEVTLLPFRTTSLLDILEMAMGNDFCSQGSLWPATASRLPGKLIRMATLGN